MQAMIARAARAAAGLLCGWLLLAGAVGAAGTGQAGPVKLALVIGNSQYAGDRGLLNAGNDARLMARTLAKLGFAVTEQYDLGRDRFASVVNDFADRLPSGATAFVYYAGHGMQLGGSNYLTPVDMPVTSESSARVRSYALGTLLDRLARAKSRLNIVVLDACRNNPFQPGGAVRYRSFSDLGLSRVQAPRGTLIAYSTSPGQLAPDGKGGNSLYTATLARVLAQPGVELEAVFRRVGNEVRRQTHDDQIPWYESSLADGDVINARGQAGDAAGPRQQATRGLRPAADGGLWYRQMIAAELSELDWEVQQRVKRLTPDELPALRHQAAGGSVVAQTVLGLAYREGIEPVRLSGSSQVARHKANNGEAWKWLQQAANAGFPMAQVEIGEMYYTGHGTERNLAKSRQWLEAAAAANYPRAKLDLLQLQATTTPGKADYGDALRSVLDSLQVPQAPRR
ncbi:caspase family protein [Oxalobacteraceae bacterium A2-2]